MIKLELFNKDGNKVKLGKCYIWVHNLEMNRSEIAKVFVYDRNRAPELQVFSENENAEWVGQRSAILEYVFLSVIKEEVDSDV